MIGLARSSREDDASHVAKTDDSHRYRTCGVVRMQEMSESMQRVSFSNKNS